MPWRPAWVSTSSGNFGRISLTSSACPSATRARDPRQKRAALFNEHRAQRQRDAMDFHSAHIGPGQTGTAGSLASLCLSYRVKPALLWLLDCYTRERLTLDAPPRDEGAGVDHRDARMLYSLARQQIPSNETGACRNLRRRRACQPGRLSPTDADSGSQLEGESRLRSVSELVKKPLCCGRSRLPWQGPERDWIPYFVGGLKASEP